MTARAEKRIAALQRAAAQSPHGTRSRYSAGRCRCHDCRRANADYEHQRAKRRIFHGKNPFVSPDKARAHILSMRRQSVGYKTLADVANVPSSLVHLIINGERTKILRTTEAKILSVTVDSLADGARIPAGPTWVILDRLIGQGFTRTWLAQQLGSEASTPSLQISRKWVTARNARLVENLAEKIDAGLIERPRGPKNHAQFSWNSALAGGAK